MKKIFFFLGVIGAMFFVECDYVNNVVEPGTNNTTGGGTVDTKIYRKVLIEDYTGHQCINCPRAAKELHRIDSLYHGKIIPLAIHAGTFANTNTSYPRNLKTSEGTTFNNTFGFNTFGYPGGLVSRKGYGTPNFNLADAAWETEAASLITQEADFQIKIKNTFVSATNNLTSVITVKALKSVSGTFNLSVILIQDSIKGPQKYPTYSEPNYVFNHVMRGALSSNGNPNPWGEQLWSGNVSVNDSIVTTYSNFSINPLFISHPLFVPKHCHIIAYVYDNDNASATYYEIKQAEIAEMVE